jgi:hypothetical protein
MSTHNHAHPVKNVLLRALSSLLLAGISVDVAFAQVGLKSASFDRDPGWLARNNRIVPKAYPTVVQNFGFSNTNFAGSSPGEMGGPVTRAYEPAFYGDKIGPKTLDDKLSASGSFAVTKTVAGGGLFFGFFRAEQPGGGGRPICSLGLDLDCEQSGCRLAVRLITAKNQSCGTFITPYLPGKFRPTPLKNDGTRYHWKLDYDPHAADGKGRFTFTLTSDTHKSQDYGPLDAASTEEARVRFPNTTVFAVDLTDGFKQHGTVFDHFGMMNMMKTGGNITIYCDDLEYVGRSADFAHDPSWDAAGNRATYRATDVGGAHNFGFSNTNHAGGKPGEIGGVFWRTEKDWGYYADRVAPLSLNDRLEARGKVKLVVGGPDADMCFGWFRTDNGTVPPNKAGDFLGIKIGGPTRVGHLFAPSFTVNAELRGLADRAPVLVPGKAYEWTLVYDPSAGNGSGAITATLGDETVTLPLKPGQKLKAQDARFDRFGLFSIYPGGQIVRMYVDDLQYTADAEK